MAIRTGIFQGLPVMAAYFPIAFAFGISAAEAGLSFYATAFMSILVYAGSSQMIAVGLFALGQPIVAIVATTFIVNLRHLLMSSAIAPHLSLWPKRVRVLFGLELTDETFALHSTRFRESLPKPREAISTNVCVQASWVTGTLCGYACNSLIMDTRVLGLDYALPAMFISLVILQVSNSLLAAVAIGSGALSVILVKAGFGHWAVIVTTLIAATAGLMVKEWASRKSS